MAQLQNLSLGQLLGQAEQIQAQRRQNRLAELMAPIQQQSAQLGLDQARLGQTQQLARGAVSILGDAPQQNWGQAVEFVRSRGGDVTGFEQYSPQAEALVKQLATGGAGRRVQSTYINDQGQRVAIYADGTTEILGTAGTPSRVVDGVLVDTVTGRARQIGGQGEITPEQIRAERQQRQMEEVSTAALKAEEVEKARQRAAQFEKAEQGQDVMLVLDEMERLVSDGVYTGGIIDRFGRMAAAAGVPFDNKKAANTVQLRQMATQLKLMAKPPGMGAMSDSEWKILQSAIPDPDSGTAEQIIAGINAFRQEIARRTGMQKPAASPRQGAAAAPSSTRMRYNPATGQLEPAQ